MLLQETTALALWCRATCSSCRRDVYEATSEAVLDFVLVPEAAVADTRDIAALLHKNPTPANVAAYLLLQSLHKWDISRLQACYMLCTHKMESGS